MQRILRQTQETLLHFISFELLDVYVVIILTDKSVVFPVLLNLSNQVRLESLLKIDYRNLTVLQHSHSYIFQQLLIILN